MRSLAGGCSVTSVNKSTAPMAAETNASPATVQIPELESLFEFMLGLSEPSKAEAVLTLKLIPHSPDGLDVSGLYRIGLQLLAQLPDVEGDGADVPGVGGIPNLVHELLSGVYPAGIGRQGEQQVKFLCCKLDWSPGGHHRPAL